ncbi:cysteine hydrolase [Nocardioides immobilis]|uniref:Cysteine hydrolase n=1 Tax=Nocardioides immobilis TaxID=2049295 RepID=A0A417Y772_9ACTN|nr:cysteine hydrolase [Nocardioides immobilis]RHW28592.1 cysteine hydrolase [Nocardioides immobilis]
MSTTTPSPYYAPALVISECQIGILDAERSVSSGLAEQAAERSIVGRIAELAELFRERGLPVVHCIIEHRPDQAGMLRNSYLGTMALRSRSMTAGTPDVEIPAVLGPLPGDFVSSRATGLTAFYGTDLDATLRLNRVRTLVLAGVSTNVALPGLALEAVNRGYDVVLAEDCTAGSSAEAHEFFVRNQLTLLARGASAADVAARLPQASSPRS